MCFARFATNPFNRQLIFNVNSQTVAFYSYRDLTNEQKGTILSDYSLLTDSESGSTSSGFELLLYSINGCTTYQLNPLVSFSF